MKVKMSAADLEEALEEMDAYFSNLRSTELGQANMENANLRSKIINIRSKLLSIQDMVRLNMNEDALRILEDTIKECKNEII